MREAREELAGWAWVGIGGLASVLVPLWLLLTAVVIQLSPELAGFRDVIELGVETGDNPPVLWTWLQGGVGGGLLLLVVLPLVGGLGAAGWAVGQGARRRQLRDRLELDEALREDTVLQGVTLTVHAERSFDPRAAGLESEDAMEPASRGRRFAAVLVDAGLLTLPYPVLPGSIAGLLALLDLEPAGLSAAALALLVGGLALAVALGIYQLVLLSQSGQTLGKRWLGVRVVRSDGTPAGFWHAVVLRLWAFSAACLGIPVVGWFVVPIVDLLMLLGEDGRTLHDLLADTVVVDARVR